MEEFVRWSLKYDMWCKMRFFGDAIERKEYANPISTNKRGPQNMLDLLPDIFTFEDAKTMRLRMGIQTGSPTKMLSNWKSRGYIEPYGVIQNEKGRQQYTKTEKYLKEHAYKG